MCITSFKYKKKADRKQPIRLLFYILTIPVRAVNDLLDGK